MIDINKLKPAWHDHTTNVPEWIAIGIGRTAMEWATVERELEELIRVLIDGEIQQTRVMLNTVNAKGRVLLAVNLVQSHIINKRLTKSHLKFANRLKKRIEHCETKRDVLAHGLWAEYPEYGWVVLRMRQTREVPQLQPTLERLSRAVLPQREPMTPDKMLDWTREIVTLSKSVVKFCDRLSAALAPLRNTGPQYTRRRPAYRRSAKRKSDPSLQQS